MNANLETVKAFAISLDQERYDETLKCLAPHCVYDSPEGIIDEPKAIVTSYQKNGDQALDRFDSINYGHTIDAEDAEWFSITFRDDLAIGNRRHTFQCKQRIRVQEGEITRIIHQEIPGERETLDQFLQTSE